MRKIWWHWQNLNEDKFGRKGSGFWHGRAWLHIGERLTFEFCWNFKSRFCHAYVEIGGAEEDFRFSVAFPPIALWFTVEGMFPYRILPREMWGRQTGISIHDGTIWFSIWHDDSGWKKEKSWQYFNFCPADFFLGIHKYSQRILRKEQVEIPIPEKTYRGTVEIFESVWKRPRWPFAKKIIRAKIAVEDGIPVPGKGENAWDCGEDAIYSLTCPASSVEEAIAKLVESCLERRRKYGGEGWRPAKQAVG